MSKFQLAIGLHNHQPVGNFESVFRDAHANAYEAFLKLFAKYDGIRLSLHQSGILWKWQEHHHPEYLDLVRRLVQAGRLELMTGGFYEPILIAVPERDAIAQIAMLNNYLKHVFDVEPGGLWLTERIWEPHMPSMLVRAGVKYLPVDDTHFIYAGFDHSQLTGPFVTENNGETITLLPIQKRLRYLIPFSEINELMDDLKRQADANPEGLAVYADDGEKFGVWPKTHEHCYTEGWLDAFFTAVEENSDWLEVIPLGEAAQRKAVGRAYLPSASYEEMLHWALPANAYVEFEEFEKYMHEQELWDRFGRFVRGGHWRGFMVKYEEANLMHKKMLAISERLHRVHETLEQTDPRFDAARDHLFAAQCNCPYWHGVFGGLYLPHIRQAVFSNMIEADRILDQLDDVNPVDITVTDYDADGLDEIIVKNGALTGVIKPSRGGSLLELSTNDPACNLTDTLSRRTEGYHNKLIHARLAADDDNQKDDETASIHDLVLTKEEGLQNLLINDWHLKRCFIDHFMVRHIGYDDFRSGNVGDEGDFVLEPYVVRSKGNNGNIVLSRVGHVWRHDGPTTILIEKSYRMMPGDHFLDVTYRISAPQRDNLSVRFAVENNLNFQAGHAHDRYLAVDGVRAEESYLDSEGCYDQASRWVMVDEYRKVAAGVVGNRPGAIWHAPIYTVSLSEGGFEKVYQGTTFLNIFDLALADEPVEIAFRLHAGRPDLMPVDLIRRDQSKKKESRSRVN
jgi:alpha-amylase